MLTYLSSSIWASPAQTLVNTVNVVLPRNRRWKAVNYEMDITVQMSCDSVDLGPVEVYPVWNDEYLKNIRIDENYLKGIILQSRGKLKGNYNIITPETCTLLGDPTMKNSAGDDVHFKMLKFPYKILEDVSLNFQIQEQPSSEIRGRKVHKETVHDGKNWSCS